MGSSLVGGDEDIQMASAENNGAAAVQLSQNSQNAPIEKKTKNNDEVSAQIPPEVKAVPEQKQAEDKKKLKEQLMSLFHQVQAGCVKDVCFKKYCKKNPFGKYPRKGNSNFWYFKTFM